MFKIKRKRRRKQAISSHIPYCLASFLGGPLKFTLDGLKKYPDVSTHSAGWVKSLAVLQNHMVYVHYSFTFHLLVWVLLLLDNHFVVVHHADTVTNNKWLSSNLRVETEELLVVAQDQAINTRNYQKVICGQQVKSKCRMCW